MKKTTKFITIFIAFFLMFSLCTTMLPVRAANETENTSSQEESSERSKTTNGNFTDASGTMYIKSSVNFRESDTTQSESYGRVSEGKEVTILGKGDNGWYKVEYDGKTGYIKGTYLTSTNPNKEEENTTEETGTEEEPMEDDLFGLDELSIEDVTLTPEFKKGVYEYTGTLTKDLTQLNVNAVCNDEEAKIDISGNQEIQEGENLITIVVTGKDSKGKTQTITYQVTVTKDLSAQQAALVADMENAQKELNKKLWLARGAIVVLVFAVITYLIIRYKSQDNNTATEFSVPFEALSNQSDEEERDYREEYLNQFSKKEVQEDTEIPKALREKSDEEEAKETIEDIDQQTRKFNLDDFDLPKKDKKEKGKHF